MRLGRIVEGQDAPAEATQEKGAERDENPEGKHGDDLSLDNVGQRDELQVEAEVERSRKEED